MTTQISRDLLAQAVDQSNDGITIADASQSDWPLIYVNAGFERLTGYNASELLGKSCHFLQGTDTNQPEITLLRDALQQGKNCLVTLRNYRRDGSMFWNELSLSPVRNEAGTLTHYIGIQHDVTARILPDHHLHQTAPRTPIQPDHPVIDIDGRFEEQFSHMLQTAQRTHSLLSVLVIQPDEFKHFNERYGHAAGHACLRMVGERAAKSFGRSSDCIANYNGDEFAVVSTSDSAEGLQQHLQKLRDQIRALNIPHSDTPDGVVTICIGVISLVPQRDTTAQELLNQANTALQEARRHGHDSEHLV
ncbi:MAG: diguanylate cyclase [Proteobacteria bacterium]|nr:diguanylate cyclase [Pseudomonadota bacterium]